MHVTVEYATQIKQAVGAPAEQVRLDAPCTVQQLVRRLAERHGEPLARLVLDGNGELNPALLLFVAGAQVRPNAPHPLNDGDVVTILSPISGG